MMLNLASCFVFLNRERIDLFMTFLQALLVAFVYEILQFLFNSHGKHCYSYSNHWNERGRGIRTLDAKGTAKINVYSLSFYLALPSMAFALIEKG